MEVLELRHINTIQFNMGHPKLLMLIGQSLRVVRHDDDMDVLNA
jgi:hypothetical protein